MLLKECHYQVSKQSWEMKEAVKQIVKEFCEYTLMNTPLSLVTVDGYSKYLHKVLNDLGKTHPTADELKRYMLQMRMKKYSTSYINNVSTALEKYMAWLGIEVKLPRLKRHHEAIVNTLTPGEIARMIAATRNSREKAMIAILAYSGIRVRELCNLRVEDVHLESGTINIANGKGGIDRTAYIAKEAFPTITQYLKDYPRGEKDFLFTTIQGNKQYNGNAVRKILRRVAKEAGVEKRVYPHLLRHSLATNLLNRGVDILTIQSVLGHRHLQSTLIYAHSSPQKVKMEYNYYVPSYI